MLRLSVLAIALTLGIGPNASILCRAWCAGDDVAQACHRDVGSTEVSDGCCEGRLTSLTAVLSGDARQGPDTSHAETGAPPHHVAVAARDRRPSGRPDPWCSNDSRHLTVLRI